jgi:RNA polymerase sigma-70 factor (ECF subfamily)
MVTDEALMAAYKAGDRAAFGEIFRRYSPLLLRVMQHQLSRREDAQDLVQQTFLQLHRSRYDFRPEARLRPWLLTIAVNLKRQYFRRLGRRPESPLNEEVLDLPAPQTNGADPSDAAQQVKAVLAELPADQREVIVLHWLEGLPFTEVALVVGASLSAVKVRAHRGYVSIRRVFGQDGGNSEEGIRIPLRRRDVGAP